MSETTRATGHASDEEKDRLRKEAMSLAEKNERLAKGLDTARSRLVKLQERVDTLTETPLQFGQVMGRSQLGRTADVLVSGRRLRVHVDPALPVGALEVGEQVLLNDALVLVGRLGADETGEIVVVKEQIDEERVLVLQRGSDEQVVRLGTALKGHRLRFGDALLCDMRSRIATATVIRSEIEELLLEERPDTEYSDIGGLGPQIEQIRDTVELPFRHPELYREFGLRPPQGVLLYGPPGCGKTLIARAVATSLAKEDVTGRPGSTAVGADGGADEGMSDAIVTNRESRSYFLNVKGPELLNKYVGETERQIRVIFARAREKAAAGIPVVIFFDEMEALFRTRGTGRSSDVETTVVPQLLAEIDGVEKLDNVIVIGASNREDMIDPAILRPGRLDVKIRIDRPDEAGARDIFSKYLTPDLPLHPGELSLHGGDRRAALDAMIVQVTEAMYARDESTEYLEVTYATGEREILHLGDFASGAMITNVVDRAKKAAIKDLLAGGVRGLTTRHLLDGLTAEARENEHMPSAANPEEWARISGRRGERVTYLRPLIDRDDRAFGERATPPAPSARAGRDERGERDADSPDVTVVAREVEDVDTGGLL